MNIASQAVDNLFNANHRNAMIAQHGATSAQWTTIEQLIEYYNNQFLPEEEKE